MTLRQGPKHNATPIAFPTCLNSIRTNTFTIQFCMAMQDIVSIQIRRKCGTHLKKQHQRHSNSISLSCFQSNFTNTNIAWADKQK